jgi:hypothetical protein
MMDLTSRTRPIIVFLVVSLAFVTCGVLAPLDAAWGGVVTPSSVIGTAKLAIAQQASAHVVFVAHADSPSKTETIVADVGRASGTETVTEGTADLAIRLSPSYAYISGNSSGLTTIFGMSSADAKKVGGLRGYRVVCPEMEHLRHELDTGGGEHTDGLERRGDSAGQGDCAHLERSESDDDNFEVG